ncbi:hypothetical protein RNM28_01500 [Mesomycoplasma ovipneumoniae]|uniref:hypothetical protein n=1 Tax=Mesomycoplasma ovipneumoniae TaxID=29562 RepID=UPI0028AC85AF|nr:hypothetical protein [Mesomycoplasma ovipneumoniae]WNM17596.1 hypothetical protein RNM28_01500 [Mesomycoplasma ovipneumoniae]
MRTKIVCRLEAITSSTNLPALSSKPTTYLIFRPIILPWSLEGVLSSSISNLIEGHAPESWYSFQLLAKAAWV